MSAPDEAPGEPFRLLILDCDGVLVDSERIANRVFAEMLGELGLTLQLNDMFEHFVGLTMTQCLDRVADLLGRPAPLGFVAAYDRRTRDALEHEVQPVPGIVEALDHITLPCCVASNGEQAKMRISLGATGLWPRFRGRTFSAEEVPRPKPAPDVYLLAAERNGTDPADCLVVEDTPTGIAAAAAAGMTVFGYAANMPAQRLRAAGAHAVFEDMRELPARIAAGRPRSSQDVSSR
ncbi:HAD family phosphatase [Oleiagrimonas sp. MCCC 1A03011]|uniref:HAD family hydrolase n=1 Tax=Oleiagrimonas sp. MCCC 1A03011 TaxID=1926883 RepID=UPI000DC3B7CA|nr:HAD family phosphatase [Oleiagrimonas sp. MCCC 1A03011]RAP57060.1 HAD family hydrolase [Oleiagrimonas sp. MCCC 1A03011]